MYTQEAFSILLGMREVGIERSVPTATHSHGQVVAVMSASLAWF